MAARPSQPIQPTSTLKTNHNVVPYGDLGTERVNKNTSGRNQKLGCRMNTETHINYLFFWNLKFILYKCYCLYWKYILECAYWKLWGVHVLYFASLHICQNNEIQVCLLHLERIKHDIIALRATYVPHMLPGYPVMARLPNHELVIKSRSQATKSQCISIKCTATEI